VTKVYDLGAAGLYQPAHDVYGRIVAIEEGSRCDYPDSVFQLIASVLAFTHVYLFLYVNSALILQYFSLNRGN